MEYADFINRKSQLTGGDGFDPIWMPDFLFDFQKHLVEWALKRGRAAIFADCGLGKTIMQLVWAENVKRKTGKPVLILTPLAVGLQTCLESEKFGIDAGHCRDGKHSSGIVVTNYERLHYFSSGDFSGVVCDESQILKNCDGETRKAVTAFMRKHRYRLLCTATAAPNDYIELGTSSEAVGELGFMDMLSMFFKKQSQTCSRKDEFRAGIWRFRGHAEKQFWRWVCSWARAVRKPSDLGFDDSRFALPELITREHIVKASRPANGCLFVMPAITLQEQREERRNTLDERCHTAASIINGRGDQSIAWCHLNDESKALTEKIVGAIEISGGDSDEAKEDAFMAFAAGKIKALVTKPTIAGLGLNFQNCHHQTFFPSHSFEQWYQSIRRCWRFGQKHPVEVDMVSSEGEHKVLGNLLQKSKAADIMFDNIVSLMQSELKIDRPEYGTQKQEMPKWL